MKGYRTVHALAEAVHDALRPLVEKMTPAQIRQAKAALPRLTGTNCWYAMYQARDAIASAIFDEEIRRAIRARASRPKARKP